jgi:diaminopimelate epimerase
LTVTHAATMTHAAGVTDGAGVRALIWERGVGRTVASGTSACAVAVAMVATGRLPAGPTTVSMPGGNLQVAVDDALDVVLRGPVEEILDGTLRGVLLATFERAP